MNINKDKIVIKPLTEEDIPLFSKRFDKEYINKWFGDKEHWLNELKSKK